MSVRRRINEMIYVSHAKNEKIFPIRMQMEPCFLLLIHANFEDWNNNGGDNSSAVTVTAKFST